MVVKGFRIHVVSEFRPFLLVTKVCSKSFQCIFSKWPFSDLSISLAFFTIPYPLSGSFIVYVCGATNILSSCIQIIHEECASLLHLQILDASRYLCLKNFPVFGCLRIYLCLMNSSAEVPLSNSSSSYGCTYDILG